MPYITHVFLQGDDAHETLEILEEESELAALQHLQLNYETEIENATEEQPWGESDKLFLHHDLVLSWNPHIPYVSLTRIVL